MVNNKPHSIETKLKISNKLKGRHFSPKTEFKKGYKPYFSEEHKRKLSLTKLNDNNPSWKGDNVKYGSLHEWIRRHKIKPLLCERCNKNKKLDLSNISGEYKRDIDDYEWLCRSCHMKKDGIIYNIVKMRNILL